MFTTWCDVRVHHVPGEWVFLAEFEYRGSLHVRVPRGFITDFASIPYVVRGLPGFDITGKSREPAGLHDWLYCAKRDAAGNPITRKQADDLFLEALTVAGVSWPLARIYYAGVRSGGWRYWRKRETDPLNSEDFVTEEFLARKRA